MEPPVLRPYREGLRNWLRTATKRLCIEAKWRVYQEILAHHAETVDAHREEGLSEDEAHERALASLGPPRRAARDFRRTHLTVRQAKRLKGTLNAEKAAVQNSRLSMYAYMTMLCGYAGFAAILIVRLSIDLSMLMGGSTDDFWETQILGSVVLLIMAAPIFLLLRRLITVQRRRQMDSAEDPVHRLSASEVVSAHVSQAVFYVWGSLFYLTFLVCLMPRDSAFFLLAVGACVLLFAAAGALMFCAALLYMSVWLKLRRGAVFTDPRGRVG